jgi:hypothetical protein
MSSTVLALLTASFLEICSQYTIRISCAQFCAYRLPLPIAMSCDADGQSPVNHQHR